MQQQWIRTQKGEERCDAATRAYIFYFLFSTVLSVFTFLAFFSFSQFLTFLKKNNIFIFLMILMMQIFLFSLIAPEVPKTLLISFFLYFLFYGVYFPPLFGLEILLFCFSFHRVFPVSPPFFCVTIHCAFSLFFSPKISIRLSVCLVLCCQGFGFLCI